MAKRNRTQTDTTETTAAAAVPPFDMAELLNANGENLKAMMRANEAALEGLGALGREMLTFGNARLHEDLAASESLMCCKDAGEAFRLQMDFARQAGEQYYAEANKLMELASKMAQDCWSPLEGRAQATLETLNTARTATKTP